MSRLPSQHQPSFPRCSIKRLQFILFFSIWISAFFLNAAPPLSLQKQISSAPDGATIHVPAGTHSGNLVIDHPLHLVGDTGAIILGDGKDHVIHITAPNVTIESLEIRNSGKDLSDDHAGIMVEGEHATVSNNTLSNILHGIYVKGVSHATIDGNTIIGTETAAELPDDENVSFCSSGADRRGNGIHLWNSEHNKIRNNSVANTRDGIYLSFAKNSLIENNHVTRCRYGLHYMYSDSNTVTKNSFSKNAAGAALMFSKDLDVHENRFVEHRGQRAGGVVLHSIDYSRFNGNDISRNRAGLYLQNSNGNVITKNHIANNYIGLRLTGSSTRNSFVENINTRNLHAVDLTGRDNENRWDDGKRGNYWSGSSSPDLDGDGVGEWPHREVDILGQFRERFPLVALLSASPFAQAAQFAFQHAPVPGVPAIRDNRPLRNNNSNL